MTDPASIERLNRIERKLKTVSAFVAQAVSVFAAFLVFQTVWVRVSEGVAIGVGLVTYIVVLWTSHSILK